MSFYVNYECCIITELTFLKELIVIRQAHRKSVMFVSSGIFQVKGLSFN